MKLLIRFYPLTPYALLPASAIDAMVRCWMGERLPEGAAVPDVGLVELPSVERIETSTGYGIPNAEILRERMERNRSLDYPLDLVVFCAHGRLRFAAGDWKAIGEGFLEGVAAVHPKASRLLEAF